jgi:translation initiation factor 6
MHIHTTSINGNPNVGLYGIVTDDYVLIGKEVAETEDQNISDVFGKEIRRITIAGTSLIGVFCLWHKETLYIPCITFDDEKEVLEELGISYQVIETELTCLGNNILIGPKAALLNPDFTDKEVKIIQKTLGLPCIQDTIADVEAVGSIGVIREKMGLFHRDIHPTVVKKLEKLLGISITLGTINMGNPYIKSGILLGKEGLIIGNASGGPEIRNADEALGFIED